MARTLVVGDVHGSARELRKLIKRSEPTRIVLVGDLFDKGPDPVGVWELIREHRIESVIGNGDLKTMASARRGTVLPVEALQWLDALPWYIKGRTPTRKWVVVHAGVHPVLGLKGTTWQQGIGLGRWPAEVEDNPMWWELYRGRRLVLHGHHARFGLIDQRPYSLGLDTGCVQGGRLSGYVIETDEVFAVKHKVKKPQLVGV